MTFLQVAAVPWPAEISTKSQRVKIFSYYFAVMIGASMGHVSMTIVLLYEEYWGYSIVFSITAVLYLTSSTYFYFAFRGKTTVSYPKAMIKPS